MATVNELIKAQEEELEGIAQILEEDHRYAAYTISQPDATDADGNAVKPVRVEICAPEDCHELGFFLFPDQIKDPIREPEWFLRLKSTLVRDKFPRKEKLVFYESMRDSLAAGLSIDQALELAVNQMKSPFARGILAGIRREKSRGQTVPQAMARYRKIFGDTAVQICAACEESGRLENGFAMLAIQLEKEAALMMKLMAQVGYTLFALLGGIVVAEFVIFMVMPSLSLAISALGANVPAVAKPFMFLNTVLSQHKWLASLPFVIPAVIFACRKRIWKWPYTQRKILKIPALGRILCYYYIVRSMRVLSMSISAGIEIMRCYNMASNVASNVVFKEYFAGIKKKIIEGEDVAIAYRDERFRIGTVGNELATRIAQSSASNSTAEMLRKVAERMEIQAEYETDVFVRTIGTGAKIFTGLIVVMILFSMMIPMLSLLMHVLKTSYR